MFRARAAEKGLVDLRKQLATSMAEVEKEKAVLSQEITQLREELEKERLNNLAKEASVKKLKRVEVEVPEYAKVAESLVKGSRDLPESFTPLEFVLEERRTGVIYAGDWDSKRVYVIHRAKGI